MQYTDQEQAAMELIITLSNEVPAPISLIKEDFGWENEDITLAIREARHLGVKIIREHGCLYISLDTWPLARQKGNAYYNDVHGSEGDMEG